ncbi:hypothetical protein SETIT_2G173100v2 [Setaria italica]|uniref:DUF6598 domain-containing protein n=2 Tax=Setaria TaxID=4554 RepID=K4A233_SETIT|nr:hypothetical protein SETIT_2G173100v2 [Setaria italica]TKW32605.1 hypothetical protein SEVIR_2G178400v2 [Setaria viridis]
MTGPKRGIALADSVLIEFDTRIKNGEQEDDDDPQLIDGAVVFNGLRMLGVPFKGRIQGNCGAIDMSATLVENAVEATVEVVIFEVQSGFDLSLISSFFWFVIAVEMNTVMRLKFKAGRGSNSDNVEHHCSFKAKLHGFINHA